MAHFSADGDGEDGDFCFVSLPISSSFATLSPKTLLLLVVVVFRSFSETSSSSSLLLLLLKRRKVKKSHEKVTFWGGRDNRKPTTKNKNTTPDRMDFKEYSTVDLGRNRSHSGADLSFQRSRLFYRQSFDLPTLSSPERFLDEGILRNYFRSKSFPLSFWGLLSFLGIILKTNSLFFKSCFFFFFFLSIRNLFGEEEEEKTTTVDK